MITNPSQKYSKLFRTAYELLEDKALLRPETLANETITSLEEYFTYIGYLKEMHDDVVRGTLSAGDGGDRDEWNARFAQYAKYLMLPINEDYFVINANTRTISIPAIFAANGVGLAGDSWAETLMFEIDRYFDYVDLMRTNIYVQWTNTDGTDGSTLINLIDYDDQKIRLGWPLSSAVTAEHDGNLTFSIRFFMRDPTNPETIIYSLNILPISVKIRKPLRLGIESNYTDEHPYLFMNAIKNGILSSEINGFAEYAIISSQLPTGDFVNLTSENEQTLEVRSYTTDTGSLSYSWEFKPENAEEFLILDATSSEEQYGIIVSNGGYKPTEDVTPKPNKVYYIEAGENAYAACDKDEDFTEAGGFKDGIDYYESYAYCTITDTDKSIVGTYAATIKNIVTGKSPATTRTNNWIIPSPKEITYNTDLSVNKNIFSYEETQDTEYDISKTYYIKTEDNQYEIADITAFDPGVTYYEINNSLTLQVIATPDNSNANLSYAWYFTTVEENEMVPIENATANTYDAKEPGWYKVKTTSTLNRAQIEKDSSIAKVTLPPVAPTINYQNEVDKIVNIVFNNIGDERTLEVNVNTDILKNPLASEEFSYTWMRQTIDADPEYENAVVGQYGVTEISNNELTVSYTGTPEVFVCKVTNHLNGEEASSYSDRYSLMKK